MATKTPKNYLLLMSRFSISSSQKGSCSTCLIFESSFSSPLITLIKHPNNIDVNINFETEKTDKTPILLIDYPIFTNCMYTPEYNLLHAISRLLVGC